MLSIKKFLYFLLGAAILALGAVIAIESNVGLGAFDAVSYNGSLFFGTTVGVTMNVHLLILLIILLILDFSPRYIIGAVLTMFIGIFIDIYRALLVFPDLGDFAFAYFIIALPLFPIAVSIMINSTVPVGPIEQLPLLLSDRYNIKFTYTKTALEIVYVLLALTYSLLADAGVGSIMLGTLIITFAIGPGTSFFRKIVPKIKEA